MFIVTVYFQFRNTWPDSALSSFSFSLLVLASAPTSFEGPFGKVLHQVKAVIDTPRFSKDYKCNKIFYVLCPLNLNDIPDIEVRTRRSMAGKYQALVLITHAVWGIIGWLDNSLTACSDYARAGHGLLICPPLPSVLAPSHF